MDNFSTYFTKEQYKKAASFSEDDKNEHNIAIKELVMSLDNYIQELKKESKIALISNQEGHRTNFGYFWTQYISGESKNSEDILTKKEIYNELENLILKIVIYARKTSKELSEEDLLDQNYENFIDKVTKGNFNRFECGENYCFGCGENFNIQFENWTPTFLQREWIDNPNPPKDTKYGDFFKQKLRYFVAPTCEVEKVAVLPMEFKTGNLLISDWFRIPEFTGLVDDKHKNDINSAKGRITLAKEHAEKFNFISAPSSGSPYIFKKENRLIFALDTDYDENDKEKKVFIKKYKMGKERVNGGLRNITVIEKEQLMRLVEQAGKSSEEAQNIVDKYLKENKNEIINMQVSPGTYNIKFSGDCYELKNNLQEEEEFPKVIIPFLIMENTQLVLKKKLKR